MGDHKAKILVIDDDSGMRQSLEMLLSYLGYQVATAESCRGGIELLTRTTFDVVVTDIVTEDGLGFEVMDYVNEHCPRTRVVAMTGFSSVDSVIEALRHGAYDYVAKPFDFDLLHHSIKRALEHLRLQEEVRRSTERYQALVDDLNDGYFVVSGGRLVYANSTFGDLMGRRPETMLGTPFLDLVAPADRDRMRAFMASLTSGEDRSVLEDVVFAPGGDREVTVELKMSRARTGAGREEGLIGICRDVSERRALWEKLVRSEKLALLGEMVAGIAHELNNKLTPVLAYADMLAGQRLDEETARRIGIVRDCALGVRSIVESLLLFSRQEKPRKTMVNLNDVVRTTCELVECSFSGSDVHLDMDLDADLPAVLLDRQQIEQVILNITKNAYEALPGGGRVRIETRREADRIRVSVTDDGPGIPPEVQAHIFDPFFTTKERERGTGLGLSICHGIVRSHQGEIEVASGAGGTTFSLYFPVVREEEAAAPAAGEVPPPPRREDGRRVRILVVDDEPPIAQLLGELLMEFYDVTLAGNGREALAHLSRTPFDLIISDIKMPALDGIELYRRLEQDRPEYLDRIIYATGVTFDDRTRAFLQETGVPCLNKPFKADQILEMVHRHLAPETGKAVPSSFSARLAACGAGNARSG
ncbi:response regulator [Dissulfurirhabdus thermomarina]|uniref:histidine kinase n=1 Tax=Dissulfurirhabdus thermomarina TaxID=1765737 RepID=A0A6N9TS86_DISTH|nr:response regulator [Dissulfurirhabdus thermomarina]NDY43280.1 response regulator [Dissulfurirhabdus thermomarina]NMX23722.1 response regulator [Dissulfurirhabdus thermomarina]